MLIVKVFVNEKEIDKLYIHNAGLVEGGFHLYNVYDNKNKLIAKGILHKREKGYRELLLEVLLKLEKRG